MEVRTYLGNINPHSPYFSFIRERNGMIADQIARYSGMHYNPSPLMETPLERTYLVPGGTLDIQLANDLLIQTEQDFYGTAVSSLSTIGKTVLHPQLFEKQPGNKHKSFAMHVEADCLVLPGYSVFSADELEEAFPILQSRFPGTIRLKKAHESDGNGQYEVHTREQLERFLQEGSLLRCIFDEGVVLEPNIQLRKTTSGGIFILDGDAFCFIADQKDGQDGNRNIYLGASRIVVVRGGFDMLLDILKQTHDERQEKAQKIGMFHEHYLRAFQPVTSRISYDFLEGTHDKKKLGGITDITGRLGGTCPALILSALQLQLNPGQAACIAEVNLNYAPTHQEKYERGATVFMDQKPLRITARINQVI